MEALWIKFGVWWHKIIFGDGEVGGDWPKLLANFIFGGNSRTAKFLFFEVIFSNFWFHFYMYEYISQMLVMLVHINNLQRLK